MPKCHLKYKLLDVVVILDLLYFVAKSNLEIVDGIYQIIKWMWCYNLESTNFKGLYIKLIYDVVSWESQKFYFHFTIFLEYFR